MATLNEKEKNKLEVIKKIISKEMTKVEGSNELDLSIKQVNRLIKRFLEEGEEGLMHKSRGKESTKKIDSSIKEEILKVYDEEYYDYNFTHFYEEIRDRFDVSYVTVCNILNEQEYISPQAQHKTKKLYNENMKKAIKENKVTDNQLKIYDIRVEEEEEKHVRRSSLLYDFGQEVQMDAALFIWFGNIPTMLHLAVDKATKKVLYGWFDYQETSFAYYILLMNVILKYGIPKTIRTDKRGCFNVNFNKFFKTNLNLTQFGRMCKELKIKLLCSSEPTFKPNVERENRTFKGRLKSELRHENIIELDDANKYLNEIFIPKMNELFSYDIRKDKNIMRENTYSIEELNIIISERQERIIDNASSIKFLSDYYVPINDETGEVVSYPRGAKCTVILAYNGGYYCKIEGNLYSLLKIEKYNEPKVKEKKEPKYKGHIPAPDHPWRQYKNKKEVK